MSKRTRGAVRWSLVLTAALSLVLLLRPSHPASPEDGVKAAIDQFIEGIESRHVAVAAKVLAPDCEADGFRRPDIVRGLISLNRQYHRVNVHVVTLRIELSPDGRQAQAMVGVMLSAWQRDRETAIGVDQPAPVIARFELRGKRWLATKIMSTGQFSGVFGY